MYTKTARNRSQLFKETTWVVKLFHCLCASKCNNMQTWFCMLCLHFLGNFLLVRPMQQHRRQMQVTFYSKCCIMGSGVGTLGRKIRLAMTVMVESRIRHYSYSYHRDHILDQVIFIVWIMYFLLEKHFSFLSVLV